MGYKEIFFIVFVISTVSAQSYRVCVPESTTSATCQSMSKDDSVVQCVRVESRVDCALKMVSGQADVGFFNEEETILLGQQQSDNHRVIATVRDVAKLDPFAFEAVAVVPSTHTNGLEGLRGGVYCHPGLGHEEVTWSPRVLKSVEELAARTDRCPDVDTAGKTAEELEVDTLSRFFSAACRPGVWSANSSVDADLKNRYPNLCSLCGESSNCSRYTINMGVAVAGVRNDNRHIQALECLRTNSNNSSRSAVAYVAWQHVREYFTIRNPQDVSGFSILCTDGTTLPLTNENLANTTSPCAIVRQPWSTIVAVPSVAAAFLTSLRGWWPSGSDPGGNTWQSIMFTAVAGGVNARVIFEDSPIFPLNYTQSIRPIGSIDSTSTCLPARRWCVTSNNELAKCNWVRTASFILGLQPQISCQLRTNTIECFADIKNNNADFIAASTNYGYLARQHYQLGPVKLVQNTQSDAARIAAFVKESATTNNNINRFENLRGRRACFPEFGGLAYMAFVRAGRERSILPTTECDYARVVGEFFEGACAPGAVDAAHALSNDTFTIQTNMEVVSSVTQLQQPSFSPDATSTSKSPNKPKLATIRREMRKNFNSSVLCSACRSTIGIVGNFSGDSSTCAWDYTNMYFGNNGSLVCLNDASNDVAFLNIRTISTYLPSLNLQANQFRALCRNNSLAVSPGFSIDDNCLLAHVIDAEVLTRRSDPLYNSLNVLLDWIDIYFGYNEASASRLIGFEIFSPFDGVKNLLFKDSTIDLTEPSFTTTNPPARNYMELFQHLDGCTGAAPGFGTRNIYSILTIALMALITRFVIV